MDLATLTATAYSNGILTAQVKPLGGANASSAAGLAYHPFGFAGRPNDPAVDSLGNVTKGAVALYWYEGNTLHTMPLGDPRRSAKLPTLDKGGSVQYADVDGAYGLFSGAGGYTLKVPAGQTVTVQVGTGAKVVVADATVKIGDDAALPLGDGAAVTAILAALNALAAAMNALTPPATPATLGAFNALGGTLAGLLSGITKTQTTKAMGT